MSRPTLLAIQTLVIVSPYLTNSGRFLDAWTLFGSTIRLAHSVGLHRNPRYLDPAPPLRECATRQSLWWWILHMDQQYSVTLGRPLGISGIGDCPPPEPLTTDPTILRFSEFVNQFTVLARQILSSDRLSNSKIDDFTDKLQSLWETLPEMLQFDECWLDEERNVPEWPLNVMAGRMYMDPIHACVIEANPAKSFTAKSTTMLSFSTVSGSKTHNAQSLHLHRRRCCTVTLSILSRPIRARSNVLHSIITLNNTTRHTTAHIRPHDPRASNNIRHRSYHTLTALRLLLTLRLRQPHQLLHSSLIQSCEAALQ